MRDLEHGISPSPTYDLNGNQRNLTATGESISWDALNQPISMNGVAATYDALGRMVETSSGSGNQQFAFRPSGALLAIYNAGTSTLVKGTLPLPGGETAKRILRALRRDLQRGVDPTLPQ